MNLAGGFSTGTEDDDYVRSKSITMVVDGDEVFIASGISVAQVLLTMTSCRLKMEN